MSVNLIDDVNYSKGKKLHGLKRNTSRKDHRNNEKEIKLSICYNHRPFFLSVCSSLLLLDKERKFLCDFGEYIENVYDRFCKL